MPLSYHGLGLSPTTLSRLGELADRDANSLPEASRRQRVRRASLSETDTMRIRDADTAARAAARSSQSDADAGIIRDADTAARAAARSSQSDAAAGIIRDADTAARADARSQLSEDRASELRAENNGSHRNARSNARAAAIEAAARIESGLLHSAKFTFEELDYTYDNFERSPAAALCFLAANTGVANTPADLGPLIDGVPDVVTERCVADFMQATDLSSYHGCACCGVRTADCVSVGILQLQPYIMSASETATFDLQPMELRQVQGTCLIGGARYRLHPELVDEVTGCAWRCAACSAAKDHVHAMSLRAGCDYGSLARLQPPLPPLSILEQCIIRRSRCYRHIIKAANAADKLKGHVVLMQQPLPDELVDSLVDRVNAAREGVSIMFAGPPELLRSAHAVQQFGHLLETRKQVLLRWLQVLSICSPEHACPRLQHDLESANADDLLRDLPADIIAAAVIVDAAEMQRIEVAACDDVAGVRDRDVQEFERVAVLPRHPDMSEAEQLRRENAAMDSIVNIPTHSRPENEFGDQRAMLSRAYPWIFPLGSVSSFSACTGTLSDNALRHLLLQHNCTAARDTDVVFMVADQKRRHAVCRAAAVSVANGHMQEFAEEIGTPEFERIVLAARDGDEAAKDRFHKVMRPHVAIAGAQVPNGPAERAKAVANIYAMTYELGLPSMYLTVSPDYVHSATAIMMSMPVGTTPFPVDAFADAMLNSSTFHAPGWTSVDLGTHALNQRMPQNAVAAAEAFVTRMNALFEHLLQCPAHTRVRKTAATWRVCGVFGTPYGFYCVVEAQGRGALHFHMLYWGSYSPHVLSQALADPAFASRILTALAGQVEAELPRDLHVARMRNRALAAAGLPHVTPVRGARLPIPRALDMRMIKDLARKTASQTNVHKHSETCHHGKAGECWCRMAMPQRPCNSDTVTATLVSAESATRDIPPPDLACTSRRDIRINPLEAIDHRCIVTEYPRRRDDVPLTVDELEGLPPRSSLWLRQMHPLQNMLVSSFNPAIMVCEPANQACSQLTCSNAAKQTTHYCADYFKKDSNKLCVTASMFLAAQNHIRTYPSVAANSGTAIRTAQHLLTNAVNRPLGAMEQSGQQAAMTALGHSADLSSVPFWTCYVGPAIQYVQSLRPPAPVQDNADDNVEEPFDAAPEAIGGVVEEFMESLEMDNVVMEASVASGGHVYMDGDRARAVSQHTHYALRGSELSMLSLHDYCRLIAIKVKIASTDVVREDAPGRKCNGKFKFEDTHPLVNSHVQVLRSKVVTIRPCPPPPRMPEFTTAPPHAAGAKADLAEKAAAYFSVLFRPWSASALPDTSYLAWRDWCAELSTNSTAINRYRLSIMTRMSQGMATTSANLKASKKYRFQCARRWGSTGIDGTEPPPGRSAAADDDVGEVVQEASASDINAIERLQRLANPDRTHAQTLTKHLKHVSYVAACLNALGRTLPPVRLNAASVARPIVYDVRAWKSMSDLSAATLTALKASASISADADPALNLADPGRVNVVDPVVAWPSTDDLTLCQRSAVEKIKPFIQSRSAPNHSFLVIGGAGTGKSYFISHLHSCCLAAGVVIGQFGLRSGAYAAAAGMVLPNGQTLHSLVGLSKPKTGSHNETADYSNVFPKNPSAEVLLSLRAAWKNVGLLIIDEISMVSRPLLGCVSHRLSLILNNDADFGGLLVVLLGDFLQLPPIPQPSMAAASVQPKYEKPAGTPIALADSIFAKIFLLPFAQQKRCGDADWNRVIDTCRASGNLHTLVPALKVLSVEEAARDPEWTFATIATTGNDVRAVLNSSQSSRWAAHYGLVKLRWRVPVQKWDGMMPDPADIDDVARTDVRLWQEFLPGLEVALCKNISSDATIKGVANGRRCSLFGVSYASASDQDLMMQQLSNALPGDVITLASPPDFVIVDLGPVRHIGDTTLLPINPATNGILLSITADDIDNVTCVVGDALRTATVKRFPFDFLFCVTFHKLQGMTLARLLLDLSYPVYMPFHTFELLNVAASRVRQGAHVRVLAPGFGHIADLKVNPATVAWRAGFDDAGGFWNKQRAEAAFAVAVAADAPVGSKRARVTSARARPAVSVAAAPRVAQEGQRNQRPHI